MDTGKPIIPLRPRAIPRRIVLGHNSPRKAAAVGVADKPKRPDRAPVKISNKRRLTPPQSPSKKPASHTALSVNRHVEQHRQRGPSTPFDPATALPGPADTRWLGNTSRWLLSRLESLPTEILEHIYFDILRLSVDGPFLNFPRASLPIGSKLSSDYVRRELFCRICSDPLPIKDQNQYQPTTGSQDERTKTQSWILRQQWLTYDFIRYCIPDYMVSSIVGEMSKHGLHWLDAAGPLVNAELAPVIRRYICHHLESSSPSPASSDVDYIEHRWDEHVDPVWHVALGLSPLTGFTSLRVKAGDIIPIDPNEPEMGREYHRWRIVSLSAATQIPSRLLHGPWTVPKIELLELLIRGGATVDWIHTTAGEVAERGVLDALRENNARALRALCICDNDSTPGERKDATYTIVSSRGVGVIPEQKHLLMAIDHGCQEDIIGILIHAPCSECDLQATDVTQAIYQIEKRGWLTYGSWLAERRKRDGQYRKLETWRPRRAKKEGGWFKGPMDLKARAFGGL